MIEQKVVIHANSARANEAMKASAGNGPSLGVQHTTPFAFVEGMWALWGDGRAIADDAYRVMSVYGMLESHGLQKSVGTANQIAGFIRKHLAKLEKLGFDREEDTEAQLSQSEKAVLDIAKEYAIGLDVDGMVEVSQTFDAIAPHAKKMRIEFAGPIVLEEPYRHFFHQVLGLEESHLYTADMIGEGAKREDAEHCGTKSRDAMSEDAKPEDVELKILVALGESIRTKMVYDEVCRSLNEGSRKIAVVSPDPDGVFEVIAPLFAGKGGRVILKSQIPFAKTSFGRFYSACVKLLAMAGLYGLEDVIATEGDEWIDVATDIAMNPFASIASFEASSLPSFHVMEQHRKMGAADLNTHWRMNRMLDVESAIEDLLAVSAGFSKTVPVIAGKSKALNALDGLKRIARAKFKGRDAELEIRAIESLESLVETVASRQMPYVYTSIFSHGIVLSEEASTCHAESVGINAAAVKEGDEGGQAANGAGESARVGLNRCEGEEFLVSIFGMGSAMDLAPSSYDEVIIGDVSDRFLNSTQNDVSVDFLTRRLGLDSIKTKANRSRLALATMSAAARKTLACAFVSFDSELNSSYPSFAFDELIDSFLNGEVNANDVLFGVKDDKRITLSKKALEFLERNVVRVGESDVVSGIGKMLMPSAGEVEIETVSRGELKRLDLVEFMDHAILSNGTELVSLSPSAMEAYLDCPYKWFIERLVNPKGVDEENTPLERGTFAHEVLERFYSSLMEKFDTSQIGGLELKEVERIFNEIADEVLEEQVSLPPGHGRYVPVGAIEANQAMGLIQGIYESILGQAKFPEGYNIAASEFAIGTDDSDVEAEYAGFALRGRADRIDVDPSSDTFAIIDYKGSITDHEAGESKFRFIHDDDGSRIDPASLPSHVQALVYALAVLDSAMFGSKCSAALYTSYKGAKSKVLAVGSYSANEGGFADVSDKASMVSMSFDEFLKLVESAVKERLEPLMLSRIDISKSRKDSCKYCIFASCEGR